MVRWDYLARQAAIQWLDSQAGHYLHSGLTLPFELPVVKKRGLRIRFEHWASR